MTEQQVFDKVLSILSEFVGNADGITNAKMETSILEDLKVNSARLVDVVLELEDTFEIEVSDEDADNVRTVGDAVKLIMAAKS
ncbi:MAG TPA: acyl carrier protein [Kofleriaceae bacterium]|jgi:acyl carrier protein|nr:acyl carrier protein [Kofleriaceae bacterium]